MSNEQENVCLRCGAKSDTPLCKKCLPKARQEQLKHLNQIFYEGYAEDLFSVSQLMAVACLGEPEKILDILENEVSYENLVAGLPKDQDRAENISLIQQWARITIESTYAHAIETVFRLFIGHGDSTIFKTKNDLPLCPWLEISNLRNFAKFKKRVAAFASDELEDQASKVAEVFFLFSEYPKSLNCPWTEDEWNKAVDNVLEFLRYFAGDYIENDEYNAFKHGLVVFPGERELSIQAKGIAGFSQKGQSLVSLFTKFIEPEHDNFKYEIWAEKVSFIETDIKIAFINISSWMIDQILEIGKVRYLNKQPIEYQKFYELSIHDILTKPASYSRQKINEMSQDLSPVVIRNKILRKKK